MIADLSVLLNNDPLRIPSPEVWREHATKLREAIAGISDDVLGTRAREELLRMASHLELLATEYNTPEAAAYIVARYKEVESDQIKDERNSEALDRRRGFRVV